MGRFIDSELGFQSDKTGLCKHIRGPLKYVGRWLVDQLSWSSQVGVDVNPGGLGIALKLGLSEAAVRGSRNRPAEVRHCY